MRKLFELAVKFAGFWFVLSLAMISPGNFSKTEAGGLVVTSTADSGFGSFRDALTTAANNPGPDTIFFNSANFPPDAPATLSPSGGGGPLHRRDAIRFGCHSRHRCTLRLRYLCDFNGVPERAKGGFHFPAYGARGFHSVINAQKLSRSRTFSPITTTQARRRDAAPVRSYLCFVTSTSWT